MPLAPIPVVAPLLMAALLAGLAERCPEKLAGWLAILTSAGVTAVTVILWIEVGAAPKIYWMGAWTPAHGMAIGIDLLLTRAGLGLATLAALLCLGSLVFSQHYFDSAGTLFHVLMLVFLAGLCGFSLSGDLFNLFVCFELMGAAAYSLCGHKTEEAGPLEGALNFAVTNTVGAFFMLIGIALLYARTGALNMTQIGRDLGQRCDGLVIAALTLLAVGLMTKAAIVPFHFWLADAHAVAPTPVCVLFSGVMVEVGLFGLWRIYSMVFVPVLGARIAVLHGIWIVLGAVTGLTGALMCLLQNHIKRLLAFSTISHMGLILMALGAGSGGGALLYGAGHSLVKAALFFAAGIVLHRLHSVDERRLWRRGSHMPATGLLFVLGGFGLAGLPPFATASGADLIVGTAYAHAGWIHLLIALVEIGTGAAVLRVAAHVFLGWGQRPGAAPGRAAEGATDEQPETKAGYQRTPPFMLAPLFFLLALALVLGILPTAGPAARTAAWVEQHGSLWQAQILQTRPQIKPLPPPALMRPEKHAPAPMEWAIPGLAVLLALTMTAWKRSAWPAMVALPARAVASSLHGLRLLHSGRMGDYVTWLLVGTILLAATFTWRLY
jgi:multicomponent Na+:H+ antiporter subunit D